MKIKNMTQNKFDALVNLMDDEIREKVHAEADYTRERFLLRYLELDSSLMTAIEQEFAEIIEY